MPDLLLQWTEGARTYFSSVTLFGNYARSGICPFSKFPCVVIGPPATSLANAWGHAELLLWTCKSVSNISRNAPYITITIVIVVFIIIDYLLLLLLIIIIYYIYLYIYIYIVVCVCADLYIYIYICKARITHGWHTKTYHFLNSSCACNFV